MSFKYSGWVRSARLRPSEKAVLDVMAECANDQGISWPSIPYFREVTCLSDRQIQRVIKLLADTERDSGPLIKVVPRFRGDGSHTSNEYHIIKENIWQIMPEEERPRGRKGGVKASPNSDILSPCGDILPPLEPSHLTSQRIKDFKTPPYPPSEAGTRDSEIENRENREEDKDRDSGLGTRDSGKLTLREVVRLAEQFTGRTVNGLQKELLMRLCREYPPERIRAAFVAGEAGSRERSLNWIRAWLANPVNSRLMKAVDWSFLDDEAGGSDGHDVLQAGSG